MLEVHFLDAELLAANLPAAAFFSRLLRVRQWQFDFCFGEHTGDGVEGAEIRLD